MKGRSRSAAARARWARSASASPVRHSRRRASLPRSRAAEESEAPGPWRKGFADGQLPEGAYFEGELLSGEDLALFKACAVEGHDASARVEVSTHGARLASTRQALTTAFGGSKAPMVHLCPQAASACSGPIDGRDAVHVPRWRTRPIPGIKEQGYEVDAADLTGTSEEVKAMGLTALRERLLTLKERLGTEARSAPDSGAAKDGQALSAGMGPAGGGKPAGSHTPR